MDNVYHHGYILSNIYTYCTKKNELFFYQKAHYFFGFWYFNIYIIRNFPHLTNIISFACHYCLYERSLQIFPFVRKRIILHKDFHSLADTAFGSVRFALCRYILYFFCSCIHRVFWSTFLRLLYLLEFNHLRKFISGILQFICFPSSNHA